MGEWWKLIFEPVTKVLACAILIAVAKVFLGDDSGPPIVQTFYKELVYIDNLQLYMYVKGPTNEMGG